MSIGNEGAGRAGIPPVGLPDDLRERARAIAAGTVVPAVPRLAATVVLLRDDPAGGVSVFLLRRVRSMAFAPGAYVFPGGSVDVGDGEVGMGWAGPSPEQWAGALGCGESDARRLVCAAVRETFEESGVLLAGEIGASDRIDTTAPEWEHRRRLLATHEQFLAALLARQGLVVRSDLLRPWAHWITPAVEPRRYDTYFFVAAAGVGAPQAMTTEADRVTWVRPADAVARARAGQWHLLPPTRATLGELACFDSVAEVMAHPREIEVVVPRVEFIGDDAYLVFGGSDTL